MTVMVVSEVPLRMVKMVKMVKMELETMVKRAPAWKPEIQAKPEKETLGTMMMTMMMEEGHQAHEQRELGEPMITAAFVIEPMQLDEESWMKERWT